MDKIAVRVDFLFLLCYTDSGRQVIDMKIEFGRNTVSSDQSVSIPLYVNNCGYNQKTGTELQVNRKQGRKDYQFLYIADGTMECFNGQPMQCTAGDVILFRPGQPQIYHAAYGHTVSFFWFHCSGTLMEPMLSSLGLQEFCYHTEGFFEFPTICRQMIRECHSPKPNETLISSLAATLIATIPNRLNDGYHNRFRPVLEAMHEEAPRTVSEYAAMANLSPYHFIRMFRESFHTTPHAYVRQQALEKAERLLLESTLSIGEIAVLCHFSDPLYFSRVFQKSTGLSPSRYRNKHNK